MAYGAEVGREVGFRRPDVFKGTLPGHVPQPLLKPVGAGVGAFARAAGIGMVDHLLVPQRLQDVEDGVLHHAVGKRCSEYFATLGLIYDEVSVGAHLIGSSHEVVLEIAQMQPQVSGKALHFVTLPLAAPGLAVRQQQVVPVRYKTD